MIMTFVIIQLMLKPDSMFVLFKSIQCSYLIGISIAVHKFFIFPVSKKKDVKSTWVMYPYIIYLIE